MLLFAVLNAGIFSKTIRIVIISSRHEMKRFGCHDNTIEERVCEIYKLEKGDIFSMSGENLKSDARSLFGSGRREDLAMGKERWREGRV
jgi:hypothetical protein